MRVLIVDDAVAFATLISHWLKCCPEVELVGVARSGGQAVEDVARLRPDVVILDHLLYDVPEGSEALAPMLRAEHPEVGIVLVSAMPEERLGPIAARCGADAHLSKGASPDAFCAAVREIGNRVKSVTA